MSEMTYKAFITNIARTVKVKRILMNLTQDQFAKKCGLKQSMIAQIETARKLPSLETIFNLSKALGCEPYELLMKHKFEVSND